MFADGYQKSDTHLHPNIIRNPGQARSFIEQAISLGFDMICFTDHMYHPAYDAKDRMLPGTAVQYCQTVRDLAKEYKEQITIKCGIEIDYYPPDEEHINNILKEAEFDHVLGSTHFHLPYYGLKLQTLEKDSFAELALNNTMECVKSGLFDTLSHLDFFRWALFTTTRFTFSESDYHLENHLSKIQKILATLEKQGMCLEVNSSGIYKGFDERGPHPEWEILEMAKQFKLRYVFGSDAHRAENVGRNYDQIAARVNLHG